MQFEIMINYCFLIILFLFILASTLLVPLIRRKIFEQNIFKKKKWAQIYEKYLGIFLIAILILLFLQPIVFATLFLGWAVTRTHFLDLLVLGIIIVTFLSFQAPSLIKPNIYVVFLPAKNKSYEDIPKSSICLRASGRRLLFFRITNLGYNTYKKCTVWFCFPEGFMPLEDRGLYEEIDFKKDIMIQKKNRCAVFLPDKNYLTVVPTNHFVFPVWVEVSADKGQYEVLILFVSETRWGETGIKLKLNVI